MFTQKLTSDSLGYPLKKNMDKVLDLQTKKTKNNVSLSQSVSMNVEEEENAQKTFSCHLLYLFFILMGVKNVLLMLVLPQLKSCVVVVQSKRNFLGINDVSSYT